MKLDHKVFLVLKFHHSLGNRIFETFNYKDLKSRPHSSLDKQVSSQEIQYFTLPSSLIFFRNLENIKDDTLKRDSNKEEVYGHTLQNMINENNLNPKG